MKNLKLIYKVITFAYIFVSYKCFKRILLNRLWILSGF